ncbi:MAG: hypothetical protein KDK70_30790 [Myxococcales bacterium]|nr:hypothetical protein [Myxococcales bacterium]
MRLLALLLLTGCSTTTSPAATSPSPSSPRETPADPEPSLGSSAGDDEAAAAAAAAAPKSAGGAAGAAGEAPPEPPSTLASPPEGWSPRAMRQAPRLESKRGPDAFYALGGPYPDLAERTRQRALQWLRREIGGEIEDAMVMAEHAEDPAGVAWLHYGLVEWSTGDFALAIQRPEGWFSTPAIATSSKNYAARVEGPIGVAEVELGPDGVRATEYTVAFETGYSPGPFTVKLLCLDVPVPACTRPWLATAKRGGGKQRGALLWDTATTYPGDGTMKIEERFRAKRGSSDADGLQRPHPVVGAFSPFAAGQ